MHVEVWIMSTFYQVVKLIDVFPYGTGFVLVFEYMLSDLSEVLRNSARPLTEVCSEFDFDTWNLDVHVHVTYMYVNLNKWPT